MIDPSAQALIGIVAIATILILIVALKPRRDAPEEYTGHIHSRQPPPSRYIPAGTEVDLSTCVAQFVAHDLPPEKVIQSRKVLFVEDVDYHGFIGAGAVMINGEHPQQGAPVPPWFAAAREDGTFYRVSLPKRCRDHV